LLAIANLVVGPFSCSRLIRSFTLLTTEGIDQFRQGFADSCHPFAFDQPAYIRSRNNNVVALLRQPLNLGPESLTQEPLHIRPLHSATNSARDRQPKPRTIIALGSIEGIKN
jgi:hypothetical protein